MCRVLISLLRRSIISLLCRVIIGFSCHNPSRPSIGPSTGSDVQPAHRANGGPLPPAFVLSFQWSTHVGDGQTTIRRSGRARRFRRPGSTRSSGTHRASDLGRAATIPHAAKRCCGPILWVLSSSFSLRIPFLLIHLSSSICASAPEAGVTSRLDRADHQTSSSSGWNGHQVHCRTQSSSRMRHTGSQERSTRSTDHEADRPQVRRHVATLYPRPEDSRAECGGTARHLMPSRSRPWRVQIRLRHARRNAI